MVIGSSVVGANSRLTGLVLLTSIVFGIWQIDAQLQPPVPSHENNRGYAHLQLVESSVKELAASVAAVYPSSCEGWTSCEICSQDECLPLDGQLTCANTSHNKRCNTRFPNCGPTIKITMENSAVAYPRELIKSPPGIEQARSICGTVGLDPTFKTLFKKSPYHAEYYVGFLDGTRRTFPGREEADPRSNSCPKYDCRRRPWFNAALSNKNHLVILIDSLGEPLDPLYTENGYTLEFSKECAVKLLGVVNNNDRVNVVPFSSEPTARALLSESEKVVFNTTDPQSHVELLPLIHSVKNIRPAQDDLKVTSSNLTAGLQEALVLFEAASGMVTKNIVVFTNGDIAHDVALNRTIDQVSDAQVRLFIFSMQGSDDRRRGLDAAAKRAGGAHIKLKSTSNPLFQMRAYFSYLARMQAASKRTMPFWTPAYKDYYDIGEIITVVAPVFSQSEHTSLIGIAAIDVLYLEIGDILHDFKEALFNRSVDEGSIDANTFRSVAVYEDSLSDSCDFEFKEGKVMCKPGELPDPKEDFLGRMCCHNCTRHGSHEVGQILIYTIPPGLLGILVLAMLCVVAVCCWQKRLKRAAEQRVVQDSSIHGSEPGTPTVRRSTDSLLSNQKAKKEESLKAARTPLQIHQLSMRHCHA